MKNRLNITIDEDLIQKAKRFAAKHNISLSQLVELYFRTLTRPASQKNIIQMMEELPESKLSFKGDLKESYYQERKDKYGF